MALRHTWAPVVLTWLGLFVGSARAEDIPWLRCFEIASQAHQVPLDMLIGVARVESGFDPDARSDADAHGIMQIRWPLTANHLGVRRVSELYNPCVNIDVGASYLAELLERYNGNTTLALAAYNYGPSRLAVEADIPRQVRGYVRKVRLSSHEISQPAMQSINGVVTVNVFERADLAARYAGSIDRLMGRSITQVVESRQGRVLRHHVLVDRAGLTALDHQRLARVLNLRVPKNEEESS